MYPTMASPPARLTGSSTTATPVRAEAVTVARAAALLDCHVDTVRRLIRAGKLKVFRVGRGIRIRRDVLNEFTKSR